jgi:hypothetical protein
MAAPASKADLMNQINQGWSAYFDAASGVDPAQALVPGADGWSVKDQVAHVSAWERSLLALLTGESRAEAIGFTPEEYAAADIDQMNARIVVAAAGLSLAEAMSRAEATHAELLAVLDRLTWEDLQRPYTHYQPNSQPDEDLPVIEWVLGNTVEHYAEHQGYLEQTRDEVR